MDVDEPTEAAGPETGQARRTIVVALVASPGPATELAEASLPSLAAEISARLPGPQWDVRCVSDHLVAGPADLSRLIGAARRRMLDEDWHLVVCISDLPLQTAADRLWPTEA